MTQLAPRPVPHRAPPLVLGAAGFLGINLVDALIANGVAPRCGRRTRSNVLALRQRRVPLVPCDFDVPDELTSAMRDVDVVYHLGGHYPRLSLHPAKEFVIGMARLERVLDAAAAAGVRRLVYVSSTATVAPSPRRPSTEADVYPRPPGFGTYHDLKWHLEARAAQERRLEVVVACPGACLGPWDLRIGTTAMVVAMARGLDVPHPDGLVSWVDARDVAAALVTLGTLEVAPPRVLLSAQTRPLQAVLDEVGRFYGRRAPAPMSAIDAQQFADDEERRAEAGGPRPSLARELVDLIVHGVDIDASLSRRVLGLNYRPMATTLSDFDAWARRVRFIPPAVAGVAPP